MEATHLGCCEGPAKVALKGPDVGTSIRAKGNMIISLGFRPMNTGALCFSSHTCAHQHRERHVPGMATLALSPLWDFAQVCPPAATS